MRDRVRIDQESTAPTVERRPAPGAGTHALQQLQRRVGNAAVVHMVGAQAKLTVGAVNDPAEREADRVAADVLRRLEGGGGPGAGIAPADGGVARQIRRRAVGGSVGAEGGEVTDDVTARLERSRAGGQPMADDVRRSMEGAFGADFSGVRIHTGGEADTLSSALGARAFASGNDLFFANGEYDPSSRSGRATLAHELTHTVQQSGGARRISRLAVAGTKWESAKTVSVSSSGAVGVAIVNDGNGPVVVKPDEPSAAELLISANLINDAIGGAKEGGWAIGTPSVRIADKAETDRIKTVITRLLGKRASQERESGWLDHLGSPDTVVFSHAQGEDFTKVVAKEKATKKKFLSTKRETRKSSTVADMVAKPGQLTQLGKTAALDIFMGNSDRLLGMFNMDNWMINAKTKTISLIDNVLAAPAGTLSTITTYGAFGGGQAYTTTARDGFDAWSSDTYWLGMFSRGEYAEMASEMMKNIAGSFKVSAKKNQLREKDRAVMAAQIASNTPQMEAWLAQGLQAGREALLTTLRDPVKLVAGVPPEKKLDALTSLFARYCFLMGAKPDAAWVMACHLAEKRLGAVPRAPWKAATPSGA